MSHFTVGVIVRRPEDLESVLAKYNEQDEDYMIREIEWDKQGYIDYYRKYNKDTVLSDEEIWVLGQEEYYDRHDDEYIYCYYNPDARWDWWVLGGRWRYQLKVRKDTPHLKDKDFFYEFLCFLTGCAVCTIRFIFYFFRRLSLCLTKLPKLTAVLTASFGAHLVWPYL